MSLAQRESSSARRGFFEDRWQLVWALGSADQATGRSLVDAERRFHAGLTSWTWRLPFLTSPLVLWMIVTLLALYAINVGSRRRAERRRKWDEDDARDVGWKTDETLLP